MSFTYSGDPSASDNDEIRFYLGDVDSTDVLLTDEEIDFYVTKLQPIFNSNIATASYLADLIAGRFAREVSISADGVTVGANELQSKYQQLAITLRQQWHSIGGAGGVPDIGGILWGEELDPTVKPLVFGEGFTDNARAGQQDYGGVSTNNWPSYGYSDWGPWWWGY